MNLPKIDISALPDLDTLTASFGSLFQPGQAGNDDTIIILMVFVYEQLIQP